MTDTNKEREALSTIAAWPITDPSNMDAVNMAAVARASLAASAASAGSEPVAWRYVDARGHFHYVGYKPSLDMAAEYPQLKPIRLYTHPSPPEGAGWRPGQPITEAMHIAAVKVLRRASGLDGLPQRMLDAMIAAAPPASEAKGA